MSVDKYGRFQPQPKFRRPTITSRAQLDKYKNVGPPPSLRDAKEEAIFDGPDPENQLYYYVLDDTWYFYNDGHTLDAYVEYVFGPRSTITPMGNTRMEKVPDGFKCTLVVHPGLTEPFIRGTPNGYTSSFATQPISDDYLRKVEDENTVKVTKEINDVRNVAAGAKNDEEVLARCITKNVPYVDLGFLPCRSSIFRQGIDRAINEIPPAWMRPKDYLPPKYHPHIRPFNGINPDDIDQGYLGDCYFMCSLASLAEYPSKVIDAFSHPLDNKYLPAEQSVGAYRVTLNKSGWWIMAILDDYFPVTGNRPIYGSNRKDPTELWVNLMEKAHARAHGSYAAIRAGDPLLAMADLTGYPYLRLDDKFKKAAQNGDAALFDSLKLLYQENALISVMTPSSGEAPNSKDFYTSAGLALGHAYSVLQVVEVDRYKFVQIRNPWGGDKEWTGNWCDSDPRWKREPRVAEACHFVQAKDGTFWMEFNDLINYFSSGGACLTKFNWFDYRFKGNCQDGFPNLALEITVNRQVSAFIGIHQKDTRGVPPMDPDANYAAFIVAVCQKQGNKQHVDMHCTLDAFEPSHDPQYITARDIAMKYTFEPSVGTYLIVPRIYEKTNKNFVLSVISDTQIGRGIEIKMKSLPRDCNVFKNHLEFSYDGASVPDLTTEYQFNPEDGAPCTRTGTCVFTKR